MSTTPVAPALDGGVDGPTATTTRPPELPLQTWHRMDWRFLLPRLDPSAVACGGAVDEDLRSGLALLGCPVHQVTSPGDWQDLSGRCDVVVLVRPDRNSFRSAVAAVRPEGWICAEIRRTRPWSRGPRTLRGWRRQFERAGLDEIAWYWHVPDIATSSRIVSLDSPATVRDVLLRHRRIRFGRVLSLLARLALMLGLLPLALPEGSVVGRRPAAQPVDPR